MNVWIFIIFFVIAFLVYFKYLIAEEFWTVAVAKGYESKKYLWLCFFLGIVGYLLVIALPNNSDITKQNLNKW